MNVLITGGTGFVGTYVVEELLEEGADITIIDAFPDSDVVKRFSGRAETVAHSILDQGRLSDVVQQKKVDRIIHLASLRNTDSQKRPVDAFELNCQGTMNILEVARRQELNRVIYASSVAVYGNCDFYRKLGINPFYLNEDVPTHPANFYGATKLFNEQAAMQYKKIYDVNCIGLRLSIIIGPGKKAASQTSELNDVVVKPIMGEPVEIKTFNDQVVNLIYVKDAARALVKAVGAKEGISGVFNIGGQNVTVRDIVAEVKAIIPSATITAVESREERNAASGIDISLATKKLGYNPQFPLRKAIEDYRQALK